MEFPIRFFHRTRYSQLAQFSQPPHQVQEFSAPHQLPTVQLKSLHTEIIVLKQDITRPFPSEVRHLVLAAHEVLAIQLTTPAR